MLTTLQFGTILVSIFGIFVTLIITMFKFSRNTVTKVDLNNSTESLRLEINKRFEEVNRRFEEVNRQFEEVIPFLFKIFRFFVEFFRKRGKLFCI